MSKRLKDRKDARRVDIPGLMQCCIDLKPTRMENEVYINRKMNVTNLVDFIEKNKKEGIHYTYFHAFISAIAKVIYHRNKLNRFIKNRHLYEHNDISLAFVAKMKLNDKSEEIMLSIPIDEDDNIITIAEKIEKKVSNLRSEKPDKAGANSAIDVLGSLPNFIRVPIFGLIKLADEFGIVPKSLTKDNIYFSSMIISNLGSIKCGAIYHNLANFGTCAGLTTMGEIKNEKVYDEQGNERLIKTCEFGITLDERIGDGFYFAKSAQMIEYLLNYPELLLSPIKNGFEMNGEI